MAYLHIITRKLLTGFQDERRLVRQLDKASGIVNGRPVSPRNTGGEDDPWPKEVEEGDLGKLDQAGHAVLEKVIRVAGECDLSTREMHDLRKWMFFYLVRSTTNRKLCLEQVERGYREGSTQADMLADVYTNARQWYKKGAPGQPEWIAGLIDHMGQEEFTAMMVQLMEARIINGLVPEITGEHLYHQMLSSGMMNQFIHLISDMRWTWMQSEADLVIGDNPFCRSQAGRPGVLCGLGRHDLDVTFPVSRHLCLWMHRERRVRRARPVRRAIANSLNQQQIARALEFAWGPNEMSLTPGRY